MEQDLRTGGEQLKLPPRVDATRCHVKEHHHLILSLIASQFKIQVYYVVQRTLFLL